MMIRSVFQSGEPSCAKVPSHNVEESLKKFPDPDDFKNLISSSLSLCTNKIFMTIQSVFLGKAANIKTDTGSVFTIPGEVMLRHSIPSR